MQGHDATWGLTWSGRWHKINPDGPSETHRFGGSYVTAYCGQWVYTQDQIMEFGLSHHLKRGLVEGPTFPECKKCLKAAAKMLETPQ